MSEDYTFEQPAMTLAEAQQRIAELEAQLAAVPVEAILVLHNSISADYAIDPHLIAVGEWLAQVQPEVQP